ncbi:translation initiation factor IF-2 [Candidatus Pacearchaeota archaeon]|jgi:translation initiation factor 5B|nr:translation initiation factor IF-2 [Candidatus Pacearchaeota archaeon]
MIRQPIVTVCGHVDHGKTSILDYFRCTSLQECEAGGITQKISFTLYPSSQIKKACSLIEKNNINLEIPGFLFIDTPGHAAFTNLRKRGGSLADLAILVIDINEGIKPQTAEVIQILKANKTPFLIALNKIDNISGWRTNKNPDINLKKNIESQPMNIKSLFDERYMTIAGALSSYGFEADLFYNVEDFTKKIAMIPCSARTGEGIQELMMMLCGLSQKYLAERLKLGKESKGVILEVKKEKSNDYAEAILYDGELSKGEEIAVADIEGNPIITKIRSIEEIQPLSTKFKAEEKVRAATGLRIQFSERIDVLPGMPFLAYKGDKEKIKEIFKKELTENIKTDKKGIIAKADSLGSLEALLVLLKQSNIPVLKAGIGNINKNDFVNAKANLELDELDAIILGFNVSLNEDAKELITENKGVKIITDEVVYKLIDNLVKFRDEKRKEIEKKKLMELATLCKLEILHQYVFRNTKPAIFGVKVEAGKLTPSTNFVDETEEKIGRVKNIEADKHSVDEADEGMEVAISIPGINFERELKDKKFLYSDIGEKQFRNFKKNRDLLTSSEMKILSEIAEMKRKKNIEWGK